MPIREKHQRIIVDVDFNDEVYARPSPMTRGEVSRLVADIAGSGVDTLLLRMGFSGHLPYHTELGYYPFRLDESGVRAQADRLKNIGDIESWIAGQKAWFEKYNNVLSDYNPPAVFIECAHAAGMDIVMWIDIFDDGYPGYRSKLLDEHPEYQWTAADGKTYFSGLTSYAWPETRAFRAQQAEELLELGADGIHCSTSAHCRHLPNVCQNDFYGFERPVVDEFKKRFGADIRKDATFDHEAWHGIKGDFMTQLYKELAGVCHSRDKELWVGLQLGEYTFMSADPYHSGNVVARYRNDWKTLVDEGIADAFILGDYELVSAPPLDRSLEKPRMDYWRAKNLESRQADLFAWAAKEYLPYCSGRTDCYLFGEWLPHSWDELNRALAIRAQRVSRYGFDGIDIHESLNFEPDNFGLIREAFTYTRRNA